MNRIRRWMREEHALLLMAFTKHLTLRVKSEHIHVVAGYLSYVTLMSLVPLVVVMLSVIPHFQFLLRYAKPSKNFVYSNFCQQRVIQCKFTYLALLKMRRKCRQLLLPFYSY